jgi:hypothetical protein
MIDLSSEIERQIANAVPTPAKAIYYGFTHIFKVYYFILG